MKRRKLVFRLHPNIDINFILPISILLLIGVFAVADVSAPKAIETFSDRYFFVKQQLLWVTFGIILYAVFSQMDVNFIKRLSAPSFLIVLIMLGLVIVPGIGIKVLGARRWLNFGFIGFQPSEFAKLAMILYLPVLVASKKRLIAYMVPVMVYVGLVIAQPDFGTSVVIMLISLSQIFFSNIKIKNILIFLLIVITTFTLFVFSANYRRERVLSFINPLSNSANIENYHIKQLLYSLAMGGVGGVGIGQSKQKYLFLPEATTDSIFAIIAEETGFIGTVVVIGIYFYISLKMLSLMRSFKDDYSKSLGIGVCAWFTGQTFLNLGSISSLIPFTGVPLPLISYGGTSTISLMIAFGLFSAIVKYSRL